MTLGRVPLPLSEPTPESWQLSYKRADFWAQSALPISLPGWTDGRLNEVAAKKNLTLAKFTKRTDVLRPFLMSHTQINYQLYEFEIL